MNTTGGAPLGMTGVLSGNDGIGLYVTSRISGLHDKVEYCRLEGLVQKCLHMVIVEFLVWGVEHVGPFAAVGGDRRIAANEFGQPIQRRAQGQDTPVEQF